MHEADYESELHEMQEDTALVNGSLADTWRSKYTATLSCFIQGSVQGFLLFL